MWIDDVSNLLSIVIVLTVEFPELFLMTQRIADQF